MSISAMLLPIVAAIFLSYVGNILALALAATAFFVARNAMGQPPLSGAGRSKALWAMWLAGIVTALWIALFFFAI